MILNIILYPIYVRLPKALLGVSKGGRTTCRGHYPYCYRLYLGDRLKLLPDLPFHFDTYEPPISHRFICRLLQMCGWQEADIIS